jgi:hypothetical protein
VVAMQACAKYIFLKSKIYSPKQTLQKLWKQGKLLGSCRVSKHMQHVSRSLISSTETLSDEALAISIKSFLLHNLDNIFVFSIERNDRIKILKWSCHDIGHDIHHNIHHNIRTDIFHQIKRD